MKIVFLLLLVFAVHLFAESRRPYALLFDGFAIAAKNYDAAALAALDIRVGRTLGAHASGSELFLLCGLVAWRMQLISFCNDDNNGIQRYGERALEFLEKAQAAGADAYLCSAHRAMVCQLLASLGISGGSKYGPKAASELKKTQELQPDGYYSRLVEAINQNQAPSFVGGDTKKAYVNLEALAAEYPDSIEVKIHLASACGKTGNRTRGKSLIEAVLQTNPADLFAQKVSRTINGK